MNDENRAIEIRNQQRKKDRKRYLEILEKKADDNFLSAAQRQRRIQKAEEAEYKRKNDIEKGLRTVKDVNADDYTDSDYQSSGTEHHEEDEKSDKEEELEAIFDMNEVQIHAMLAQAVAAEGTIAEQFQNEIDQNKPVEMTEKQRIRCLLMVQLFFAGLGDSKQISIRDQGMVAKRVRQDWIQRKKEQLKAEQDKRKKTRAAKKAAKRKARG